MVDDGPARILVVDDEVGMRTLLRDFLVGCDYHVLEASDGRMALEILEKEPVDLAIVDIFMPEIDGLELLTELKNRGLTPKVIAMSGGGTRQTRELPLRMAELLGASTTLEKPFDLDVLLAHVERCLGHES